MYQYLIVIAIGTIIFMLDLFEVNSALFREILLFGISFGKAAYFIWLTFSNIRTTAERDFYFHRFVPFVALTVMLIILSFAIDFLCLHRIDPAAFSGNLGDFPCSIITFLYFSVTNFTTAGLGEINPQTTSARVFVMLELFIGYFFTILIIANIMQLRESFSKKTR